MNILHKVSILFFLSFISIPTIFAQNFEDIEYRDYTYYDEIRSVKFHPEGVGLSHAIIPLNSGARLHLSFDDLENEVMDYAYTIVHCNSDWTRSDLQELEYIDGFTGELIENYTPSFSTRTTYTHYDLFLPNEDLRWKVSGNYLLIIYDEGNDNEVVLTRRFMVTEDLVKVEGKVIRAISQNRTHQEVSFSVFHEYLNIRNSQEEISASIIQNGQWEDAIIGVKPFFIRKDELSFDQKGKITFPAKNEFRNLDLRYLPRVGGKVLEVDASKGYLEAILAPECNRWTVPYLFYEDVNGQFIIGNIQERDIHTRSDYADVHFAYCDKVPEGNRLYLYGAFTDWAIRDNMELFYDIESGYYTLNVPMKKGFYSYAYALVDPKNKTPQFDTTEGNWFQATNDYTVLIYYRPLSGRYDQLIASRLLLSERQ